MKTERDLAVFFGDVVGFTVGEILEGLKDLTIRFGDGFGKGFGENDGEGEGEVPPARDTN